MMEPNLEKPIHVHIRVKEGGGPLGEMCRAGKETGLETAFRMVEEAKKVHPNAEIHVEVEVEI